MLWDKFHFALYSQAQLLEGMPTAILVFSHPQTLILSIIPVLIHINVATGAQQQVIMIKMAHGRDVEVSYQYFIVVPIGKWQMYATDFIFDTFARFWLVYLLDKYDFGLQAS